MPNPRGGPVRALLCEGADLYNEGHYWEAHEAWEEAWHQLRDDGAADQAAFLQGLILTTAAFENLRRGKPQGFATQGAKALHRFREHEGQGQALGLTNEDAFREALLSLYLDIVRNKIKQLDELETPAPTLKATP